MALTQLRGFGSFSGRRYGSFVRSAHSVDKLTQARTFGAHTGMRYGSFADRGEEPTPIRPGVVIVPDRLISAQRRRLLERDELLLMIAGSVAAGLLQ